MDADCTELYLAKRGIEKLAGFERLVNLEVLWLNNNKLQAITALDANIRIKQLYVHVSVHPCDCAT
jgi:Leucine-rich repeat (LRR) protein